MVWRVIVASAGVALAAVVYRNIRQSRRLKQLRRRQATFQAMLGHELKTPLNGIIGLTELLQHGELTQEEQREYLNDLALAAKDLRKLLDQLLDFARLNGGQPAISPRPTDVAALLHGVETLLALRLSEKGLKFAIDCQDHLPMLRIDPDRIRQILLNLLDNAIKYSDTGTISLKCRFRNTGGRFGELHFQVADEGQGISEEWREQIFEPFVQQKRHVVSGNGIGLGLAIVAKLVHHMNGAIELKSETDKGTRFDIWLPDVAYGDEK